MDWGSQDKENRVSNSSVGSHRKGDKSSRKFSYTGENEQSAGKMHQSRQQYIAELEQQLKKQRQKSQLIEEQTIKQQTKVLQQIEILQLRFKQVQQEKHEMKTLLEASYNQLQQYKNIKGMGNALVKMMYQVQGVQGDYHSAWKWIKKVVWQYETIKKKALQWKKVYDQVKTKNISHTFNSEENQLDEYFNK